MMLANSLKFKIVAIGLFLVLLPVLGESQTGAEWTVLTSSNKDFEIAVPGGYLVDIDQGVRKVIAFGPSASVEVRTANVKNPKAYAKEDLFTSRDRKSKEKLEFGDFYGWRMEYESETLFTTKLRIASPTSYYIITASSDTKDNQTVAKFLNSIRCAERQIMTRLVGAKPSPKSKVFDKLTMSQEVIEALERNSDLTAKGKFGKVTESINGFIGFSRGLILLRKPRPFYDSEAQWFGREGMIKANIEFRKDGRIGWIIVEKKIDENLAKNVGRAAALIKFIPAEKDGKPVDTSGVIVYNFVID